MKLLVVVALLFCAASSEAFEWIAHRGNTGGAIENSIEAVTASWAIEVDAIELDVRVAKDGIVYLFHDDEISGHSLSELTYDEISKLAGKDSVPKLSSILSMQRATGYYVLDLKSPERRNIRAYVDVIKLGSVPAPQIVLQSDKLEILRSLRTSLPDCRFYYLNRLSRTAPFYSPPRPAEILAKVSDVAVDGLSIKGRAFIDGPYIRSLKATGLRVYVWTINHAERAEYYKSIGVDGVITDYARLLRRTVSALEPE